MQTGRRGHWYTVTAVTIAVAVVVIRYYIAIISVAYERRVSCVMLPQLYLWSFRMNSPGQQSRV